MNAYSSINLSTKGNIIHLRMFSVSSECSMPNMEQMGSSSYPWSNLATEQRRIKCKVVPQMQVIYLSCKEAAMTKVSIAGNLISKISYKDLDTLLHDTWWCYTQF